MAEMSRDAEIKGIWAQYGWFYRLLRGAVLIGVGVLIGMIIYAEPGVRADYLMNLFVTTLSLGATALIFDELNRRRDKDEAKAEYEAELKQQLLENVASPSNEIAKNAVHQLRRKGWLLFDHGLLKGADLRGANLQEADLGSSNLQNVDLSRAVLKKANMWAVNLRMADLSVTNFESAYLELADMRRSSLNWANLKYANLRSTRLQEAKLTNANLRRALLVGADMQAADLRHANLHDADLQYAHLQGTNLEGANLLGAQITGSEFDETTTLPDGNKWEPTVDMEQFTDSEHPKFFRSIWLQPGRDHD